MERFFEFTGVTKVKYGVTLKQIKCTADLSEYNVCETEMYAWIENEIRISGGIIYGDAEIFGDAEISGGRISGGRISGGTWEVSLLFIQGTVYGFNISSDTEIAIGCELHKVSWWRENWISVHKKHNAMHLIKEHTAYFNLAVKMYNMGDEIILDENDLNS